MATCSVTIRRLRAPHQQTTFTEYRPLGAEMQAEIAAAVGEIFDSHGGSRLLRSSGDVYIKPNAVDAKPYAFTRAEVLAAVIEYWQKAGARKVYVLENSTVCNLTRLVFEATGYAAICRRLGAVPVYLDEEETTDYPFEELPHAPAAPADAACAFNRAGLAAARTP